MPVSVKKIGDKYRVVGPDGEIEKRNGTAVDGGGHKTKQAAVDQVQAINLSEMRSESSLYMTQQINQLANDLEMDDYYPIKIMSDGTSSGTYLICHGRVIPIERMTFHCNKGEVGDCELNVTMVYYTDDDMRVTKTLRLRKDMED